jgi:hypothetical protein
MDRIAEIFTKQITIRNNKNVFGLRVERRLAVWERGPGSFVCMNNNETSTKKTFTTV